MTNRPVFVPIILLFGIFGPLPLFAGSSTADDPIRQAARLLAFGRVFAEPDAPAESAASPESLLDRHAEALRANIDQAVRVAERAFIDAFGIAPTADSAPAGASVGKSVLYHEILARHLAWLAARPKDYEAVIHRAYQWIVHRDAYPEELAYWEEHGTISYVLLVGCLEDWARRNQPGLMMTSGTPTISVNCRYLATVRLSPGAAANFRFAANPAPVDESSHPVIAPGAGAIASSGGIHFVAAASPSLRDAARFRHSRNPQRLGAIRCGTRIGRARVGREGWIRHTLL